jgi:uracil-DNA glycosylase
MFLNSMNELNLIKQTEIYKQCTNIVFGKGNEEADILFVGEAPGKNEDEQGLPFVGAAGKNLDKLLNQTNLNLNDIYITNILKCRPPKNRDPTEEDIELHTPYLIKQIKEMQPKIVCSLGNYATKFFLAEGNIKIMKQQKNISEVHGKPIDINFKNIKIKLIPLFHPAAMIYNRKLIPKWEEDIKKIKKEM